MGRGKGPRCLRTQWLRKAPGFLGERCVGRHLLVHFLAPQLPSLGSLRCVEKCAGLHQWADGPPVCKPNIFVEDILESENLHNADQVKRFSS